MNLKENDVKEIVDVLENRPLDEPKPGNDLEKIICSCTFVNDHHE